MKILCIADIHGDMDAVERIKEFSRKNNIKDIIILGDFQGYGNIGKTNDAEKILNSLEEFNLFVIPGNCDSKNLINLLNEKGVNLHENVLCIQNTDVKIIGFGGSVPTEYNTPLEFSEEEIYKSLSSLLLEHNLNHEKNFILATHCPPKNTKCDINFRGEHNGSSAISKIIEEFQPSLVLSSHIHESAGNEDKLGRTKIVNIGRLSEGNLGIIEINQPSDINFTKLNKVFKPLK